MEELMMYYTCNFRNLNVRILYTYEISAVNSLWTKKHFSQNKNCSISDAKIKQPLSLHVKLSHGGHKADVYDITK